MNPEWYLLLVILALISTNEWGIGVLNIGPLLLLAYWLMEKVFGKPSD